MSFGILGIPGADLQNTIDKWVNCTTVSAAAHMILLGLSALLAPIHLAGSLVSEYGVPSMSRRRNLFQSVLLFWLRMLRGFRRRSLPGSREV